MNDNRYYSWHWWAPEQICLLIKNVLFLHTTHWTAKMLIYQTSSQMEIMHVGKADFPWWISEHINWLISENIYRY